MEEACIPRIATGFGAGMGRHGETCGALVGAIMALGLKFGRVDSANSQAKMTTYDKVEALMGAFKEQFGTATCCDLIGCDLRTPEGNERFKRENLIDLCTRCVAFAAKEASLLLRE